MQEIKIECSQIDIRTLKTLHKKRLNGTNKRKGYERLKAIAMKQANIYTKAAMAANKRVE